MAPGLVLVVEGEGVPALVEGPSLTAEAEEALAGCGVERDSTGTRFGEAEFAEATDGVLCPIQQPDAEGLGVDLERDRSILAQESQTPPPTLAYHRADWLPGPALQGVFGPERGFANLRYNPNKEMSFKETVTDGDFTTSTGVKYKVIK